MPIPKTKFPLNSRIFVVLSFVLAACAVQPPDGDKASAGQASVYRAMAPNADYRLLAEIPPVSFAEINEKVLKINESAFKVPMSTGVTPAFSIALPEDRKWLQLSLYSYVESRYLFGTKAFFPEVQIFDEQRRYVRTIPASDFYYDKETAEEAKRIAAYIALNSDPKLERYLVIHTTGEALTQERRFKEKEWGISGFAGKIPLISHSTVEKSIRGSDTGSIKLKVYKPLKLSD